MSFNTKILKISLGLISFSLSSFAIANVPSPKQIKDNILNKYQSSANPQGAIKVSNTKQIRLLNGEIAYISSADYADSARNFWGGYILTRPKFKYSVILQKFGGQSNTYKLHPIKYNGRMIDLVEFENSSSGQGWSGTTKTLTYINGWTVHDLDKIEEESYMQSEKCSSNYEKLGKFSINNENKLIVKELKALNACSKKYSTQTLTKPIKIVENKVEQNSEFLQLLNRDVDADKDVYETYLDTSTIEISANPKKVNFLLIGVHPSSQSLLVNEMEISCKIKEYRTISETLYSSNSQERRDVGEGSPDQITKGFVAMYKMYSKYCQ
ncbi:hypothetical protein [Acinetobacter modestus]|uniref:Uncharacterized protein n=1 Tax=Acinetobacter modestus TaxID=1776740 RepID=A0ABP2TVL0_9GAMM|nr:hypothetical protein [Acinetobacter modestus]ENU26295.1 hypothetical protein F992_02632 [Acinetobacter modestus]GGA13431.1 hypothetical protein GCM10017554_06950 [Acinetobacter modestus]